MAKAALAALAEHLLEAHEEPTVTGLVTATVNDAAAESESSYTNLPSWTWTVCQ